MKGGRDGICRGRSDPCRDIRIAGEQRSLLIWLYRSLPWVEFSRLFGKLAEQTQPRPLVILAILGSSHHCLLCSSEIHFLTFNLTNNPLIEFQIFWKCETVPNRKCDCCFQFTVWSSDVMWERRNPARFSNINLLQLSSGNILSLPPSSTSKHDKSSFPLFITALWNWVLCPDYNPGQPR